LRTPLEDTLGGHPWRTPWRTPWKTLLVPWSRTPWRRSWRKPCRTPCRTPWRTHESSRVSFKSFLQGVLQVSSKSVLVGCPLGVLQTCPPGVSAMVSSRCPPKVSSRVSSKGVLQKCPAGCPRKLYSLLKWGLEQSTDGY
jgi:hypothetical protein